MQPHVVLVRTPTVLPVGSVTAQQGVPSLALAYLGAALKRAKIRVTCIDSLGERLGTFRPLEVEGLLFAGLSIPEVIARIPRDASVIGVSCLFSNDWILARKLLDAIHKTFPDRPIIIGGEHATADHEIIFRSCPYLSGCVLGEGEETTVDLVNALTRGSSLDDVKGIVYNKNGKLVQTPPRERLSAIDSIAWPDWDLLPVRNYLDRGLGMAAQGVRTLPILASRGCPYRCTFCSAPQMWGAKWYGRSVDDVMAEAQEYKRKYGIDHIEFYDMSPSVNRQWFGEFLDKVEKLGLTWNFPSGMRSEILSPEIILKMRRSGCYKMSFPIETSAPKLIKNIKKNINPERMLGLVRHAVKAGMVTKVNFIWGLPNQRVRDVLRDYLFLIRLAVAGLHDATCFAFVPYPGNAEHAGLKKAGRIPSENLETYERFLAFNVYNNPMKMRSWSEHIQDRHLTYWTLGGMALFYSVQFLIRPARFLKLISRLARGRPVGMLELALQGLIERKPWMRSG